jgi:hypothetical protein
MILGLLHFIIPLSNLLMAGAHPKGTGIRYSVSCLSTIPQSSSKPMQVKDTFHYTIVFGPANLQKSLRNSWKHVQRLSMTLTSKDKPHSTSLLLSRTRHLLKFFFQREGNLAMPPRRKFQMGLNQIHYDIWKG